MCARRLLILVLALSATLAPLGLTAPAAAAPAEKKVITIYAPMTVIGFDAKVAAANGYVIVAMKDGKRRSVKKGSVVGDVSAAGTVSGNCGSSYLRMYGSVGRYSLQTGFTLKRGALTYRWGVDVYGPTGKHFSWGAGLKNKANWDRSAEAVGWHEGSIAVSQPRDGLS